MKYVVDAEFPPLDDVRCLAVRMELYKQKKKYAYKEMKDGTVYIYFPRVNPVTWIWQHIKYYLWTKRHKEEEDESD